MKLEQLNENNLNLMTVRIYVTGYYFRDKVITSMEPVFALFEGQKRITFCYEPGGLVLKSSTVNPSPSDYSNPIAVLPAIKLLKATAEDRARIVSHYMIKGLSKPTIDLLGYYSSVGPLQKMSIHIEDYKEKFSELKRSAASDSKLLIMFVDTITTTIKQHVFNVKHRITK